ncbi:MAG: kynureninase [Anaerolineae bacterium]|nr:kynureninase [Anaerolineae bacterium]
MRTDIDYAYELDAADPLASFRERFVIADPDLIYMDGNSLGRLPRASIDVAADLVQRQWGERLIRGWNEGWWAASERIGAKIARLIGAQPDEVIVADSTSVNLFKLAVAALRARPDRTAIITDDLNFPSDLYILQGIADLLGGQHRIDVVASPDGIHGPDDAIKARLNGDAALLTLSHVVFKSGYLYDMVALTAAAHEAGALTLWDLSHAAGSAPVDLNGAGADLAIGCTYKYLNGGPGSPAFLYVRRDLQEQLGNPLTGWWGQQRPFDFGLEFQPVSGMRRFLTGTQPLLSTALIEPAVDMLLQAGIDALRAKSQRQTAYLVALWEALLAPLGFTLNSPRDPSRRGSHISLGHAEGLRIDLALINEMNVLPDFRAPDNIRLGIAPLYTSFADIHETIRRLAEVVTNKLYKKYDRAPEVT